MKVAVVTPYYKERPEILRRCVESVREQTHGDVLHYLVADGHPQPETLRGYPGLRCIDLPVAHGDYGDTPRAVGATCALAEGADVLCLLDADNLYEPDHIESLLAVYRDGLQKGEPLDAVFAYRHLFLPGHDICACRIARISPTGTSTPAASASPAPPRRSGRPGA